MSTFVIFGACVAARHADAVPPPFILPFAVVGVANAVVAVWLPMMQYAKAAARKEFELAPDPTADMSGGYRGAPQMVFANPSNVILTLLPAYQTSFILGMAMAESVALFGAVLVNLGHPITVGIPFCVVALGLQLSKFPTLAKLVAPVANRARFPTD